MFSVGGERIAGSLPNALVRTEGARHERVLYLTFDDGPHPAYSLDVCTLLQAQGVQGTFFCIGANLEKYPEIATAIVERGHCLANHSQYHQAFGSLTLSEQLEEVRFCQDQINSVATGSSKIFRAPGGQLSIPLLLHLKLRGWSIVHWSYDSCDYRHAPITEYLEKFRARPPENGDIILFHDDGPLVLEILEKVLPNWIAAGFSFRTVESLIKHQPG